MHYVYILAIQVINQFSFAYGHFRKTCIKIIVIAICCDSFETQQFTLKLKHTKKALTLVKEYPNKQ